MTAVCDLGEGGSGRVRQRLVDGSSRGVGSDGTGGVGLSDQGSGVRGNSGSVRGTVRGLGGVGRHGGHGGADSLSHHSGGRVGSHGGSGVRGVCGGSGV